MPHPIRSTTFGRKAGASPQLETVEFPIPREPSPHDRESIAILRFLDRLFLWIPHDEAPGFLDLCLVALRMLLIPLVMTAPLIALNWGREEKIDSSWILSSIWNLHLVLFPLVHELCRYSFVRRADRPLRAAMIFAGACLLMDVLMARTIASSTTNLVIELAASAAILFALDHKRHIPFVIAALVAVHTAGNVVGAKLTPPAHAGPVSQEVPAVGNMRSWAKLYPGAIITRNQTQKFLTLTDWRVTYLTDASADQVSSFYSSAASSGGLAPEAALLGLKMFRNPQNGNRFSYSVETTAHGSRVFFDAKYYGG